MHTSEEEYRHGMIIVVIFSFINNIASLMMVLFVMTQKHTRYSVARLVWNLSLSDFIQSTGFMFSCYWIYVDGIQEGMACEIQGFLINLGDIASSFWVLVICLHTYMLIVHSYEYQHIMVPSMIIIWPLCIVVSGLGFSIQRPSTPFYNSAGGLWCWISSDYEAYRFGFHYGIILTVALTMIILYAIMFFVLNNRQKRISNQEESKKILQCVSKKLFWYPLVYIVIVLPLSIERISSNFGKYPPFGYFVIAACFFTCAGLANAIVYGITRNVISVKPILENIRKRMTFIHDGSHSDNFEVGPSTSVISVTTTQEIKISYVEPFQNLHDSSSRNSDYSQGSASSST